MNDLTCPFPFSVNPHAAAAREHLAAWTSDSGLLRSTRARRRFERADFGWFAALVYPTADAERLQLMADWFAWLFLVDDQLDDSDFGRSPQRMAHAVKLMRHVLDAPPAGPAAAAPPVVGALANLWRRTAEDASAAWRARFAHHLEQCLTAATVWEADNRLRGSVPSEESYIANRRHTGAIYVCMDLIEIAENTEIPAHAYGTPDFQSALDAACDVVCWVNDVYSLDKERSLGEVHNLVYVIQHHRRLDERRALEEVHAAIGRRTEEYLQAEDRLRQGPSGQAPWLRPALAGMRTWMRGNLDWSQRTKRYRSQHEDGYVETALMEAGRP
ncbi:terpene cyclase [Streptomyces sp. S.PNR 29]|uniref:terpene synthase family protein n=1 Tax=Streptomyces sp. S.PNR 29 TaxID=2973805 RepID=UPI0025B1C64A|nr:terpene cyclase [Streptomyces sp. S.PNR 29]MDN0197966.1 terpene cyclase [Streptomyces sp. S.PNR 29]